MLSELPKLLVSPKHGAINTAKQWESRRRAELLSLFAEHVYGETPAMDGVTFVVKDDSNGWIDGLARRELVEAEYRGAGGVGRFEFRLFLPKDAQKAPVFLLGVNRNLNDINFDSEFDTDFCPTRTLIENGFGAAVFCFNDISADNADCFSGGVHVALGVERGVSSWGAIAAWAWGYSRVMDCLEQDPNVDGERVSIVGHSRGGKAALWSGAQDRRFHMVVSNESGCTGAAIARLSVDGEKVADINRKFPYWFCDNYKQYCGNEDQMPVDQHMLLALIAPSKLYVASAEDNAWANPAAEFRGWVEAAAVYRLYGDEVVCANMPPVNAPIFGNKMAYHIRDGKHDLLKYDWRQYMAFARR